ncbi:MAG: transketolase C-terminal domain-containing protein, partial [Candidatus Spechtbacterales bacterium]
AERPGPCYLRFGRGDYPVFTTEKTPFQIGKAYVIMEGTDATIVACGPLVYKAIIAAKQLRDEDGIECEVINSHTIKPLDGETILDSAKKTGCIVTAEEHQIMGGMGSAVAEFLLRNYPVPQEFIGVQDRFGESGNPDELFEAFGMGVSHIKEAVKKVMKRK